MSTETPISLSYFSTWLAIGERGLSSEAIVGHLTNTPMGDHYPHDPSDFRRCQRLLSAHPLAETLFRSAMRPVSPEWARLVDAWDEIADAIERAKDGRSREAFDLIQSAIHAETTS